MKMSKAVEGFILDCKTQFSPRTIENYERQLARLVCYLQDPEVTDVTGEQLNRFIVWLRTEYKPTRFDTSNTSLLSEAGVENYWKSTRSFFRWCHEVLNIKRPDLELKHPKYKMPDATAFTREEVAKLLDAAQYQGYFVSPKGTKYRKKVPNALKYKALLLILLDSGLRLGELTRVRISDVDLETGEILVRPYGSGQKTKPRTVYLGKSARRAVWLYLSKREYQSEDPLIDMTSKHIWVMVRKFGIKAGISHTHPHKFRSTFAIEYLRNGGDPFTLQRLLGHSKLDMTKHYLDIVESDKRRMHQKASPADEWKL
jgi:integrase/recombinase XerD